MGSKIRIELVKATTDVLTGADFTEVAHLLAVVTVLESGPADNRGMAKVVAEGTWIWGVCASSWRASFWSGIVLLATGPRFSGSRMGGGVALVPCIMVPIGV